LGGDGACHDPATRRRRVVLMSTESIPDAPDRSRFVPRREARQRSGSIEVRLIGGQRMLWTILVVLVVLWLLGFATNAVGSLIHLLLVVALVVLIAQLLSGRRTSV
jgi:hypothetical protein